MISFERISIGQKILFITLAVVATGMSLLAFFLTNEHSRAAEERMQGRSLVMVHALAEVMEGPLVFEDAAGATELLQGLSLYPSVRRAVLYDADGREFAAFSGAEPSRGVTHLHPSEVARSTLDETHLKIFTPIIRRGERLGGLSVTMSTLELAQRRAEDRRMTALLTFVMFLVCAGMAWRLRRVITQPIEELATTMREVANGGDLNSRMVHRRSDELGELYDVFNTMLAQLQSRQSALSQSEGRLRALLEAVPDLVIVLDATGKIIELPSLGELDPPIDPARLTGRSLDSVLSPESSLRVHEALERALETGVYQHVSFDVIRPERSLTFDATLGAMSVAKGVEVSPRRLVMVARDMTDRRELQTQLFQAQKMEAVGQLAGGVAHDFNNLLCGIVGYVELISMTSADETVKSYATEVLEISDRASDLVANLLSFSRRAETKREPVDLNGVLDRVTRIIRRTFDRKIEITFEPATPAPMVLGDRAQLESAVLNLAVNARDAMPEGGTLRLWTATRTVERDGEGGDKTPRAVRVSEFGVEDSGEGIPPELRKKIFEPFFTTKPIGAGSGLGLAAVYGTVQAHGGALDMQSRVGEGTRFCVQIPEATTDVEREPAETARFETRGEGHILVVDDEMAIRRTTKLLLEACGYQVTVADGGPAAIRLFESPGNSFDAVILDMAMPVMSGGEVAQRLAALDASVPIILVSGFDLHSTLSSETDALEGTSFIQKPFTLRQLREAVERALHPERPSSPPP